MPQMRRRSFVQLACAALPCLSLAQSSSSPTLSKPQVVPAGADREGKKHTIGVSSTTYKVLTAETNGALFVMEQSNHKKGGPNRHLHFSQDELFFVLEGEYIVEVGDERFKLKAGDCVLGPRGVPHVWAFSGDTVGRLLISFSPAGQMEAFFNQRETLGIKPGSYTTPANAAALRTFGMQYIGPPLQVE